MERSSGEGDEASRGEQGTAGINGERGKGSGRAERCGCREALFYFLPNSFLMPPDPFLDMLRVEPTLGGALDTSLPAIRLRPMELSSMPSSLSMSAE